MTQSIDLFNTTNINLFLGPENPYLPHDVAFNILSYLKSPELRDFGLVCKNWSQFIAHENLLNYFKLSTLFPGLKIIDKKVLKPLKLKKKHGLNFDAVPAINKKILFQELKKFASLPIEDNTGFTLLTIPGGLSVLKLVNIVRDNGISFSITNTGQIQKHDSGIDAGRIILITNNVLVGSRSTFLKKPQELINNREFEIPGLLEVAALTIFTFLTTGKHLYPRDPKTTFTVCETKVTDDLVIVGGFSPCCLVVSCQRKDIISYYIHNHLGAAIQKTLN
jgi:hypothetical protein